MKAADRVSGALKKVLKGEKARDASIAAYPDPIVETVVFHRLHHSTSADKALKSFSRLTTEFVDWNEIRVSTIQEIREQLPSGADSLDTAVFIKDFLELVHRERQCIDLEYLIEENLSDVRRFLKQVRGIDPSTIDVVLLRTKGHPVFPLNPTTEAILVAAGVVRQQDTRDRKAKSLFEIMEAEAVLPFHHFLLDLGRELEPIEGDFLSGAGAPLRTACSGFVKGLKASGRTKKAKSPRVKKGPSPKKSEATRSRKTTGA